MTDLLSPNDVADFLLAECRERGEVLTNLKLQKLLYYAQAWHLALFDKCIFEEDMQAWVHGPVLPSQYARLREYQWRPIDEDVEKPDLSDGLSDHLKEIVDVFGSETAVALELMTHRENPWFEARKNLASDAHSTEVISKDTMRGYYRSFDGNNQE